METVFNMKGTPKVYNKFRNGKTIYEIHEFCCDNGNDYQASVLAEGHLYENDEPTTLLHNISFYCSKCSN